jgi:putative transposase
VALEHAIRDRKERHGRELSGLIHHSGHGSASKPRSATPPDWPRPARSPRSGSGGDSYDNALAESTIGQTRPSSFTPAAPWRTAEQLEFALFEYLDWWNHRRWHTEIAMLAAANQRLHPAPWRLPAL